MAKAQSSGRAAWIWTGLLAVCVSLAVGGIAVRARLKVAGAYNPDTTEAGDERPAVVGTPSAGGAETWPFGPPSHAIAAVMAAFPDDFSYSEYTETGFLVAFALKHRLPR